MACSKKFLHLILLSLIITIITGLGSYFYIYYISGNVCRSESCYHASRLLADSLNTSVDPCNDFYQFACGGWEASHQIPADRGSLTIYGLLDGQVKLRFKKLLGKTWNRSEMNNQATSVRYAIDFYRECMDIETIEKRGTEPLKAALKSLFGVSWPLITATNSSTKWTDIFLRIKYEFGISPIVGLTTHVDIKKTDTNRITFFSPSFGMKWNEFANQSAYNTTVSAYRKYQLKTSELLNPDKTLDQLEPLFNEIFEFEAQLSQMSTQPEKMRNANTWYTHMTLSSLENMTSGLEFIKLVNQFLAKTSIERRVTGSEVVLVSDASYYQKLAGLLEKTPKHVILNYLGWRIVDNFAAYLSADLRALRFELEQTQSGATRQLEDWNRCVKQVNGKLDFAVSRLYIDAFVRPVTKDKVTEMFNHIRMVFSNSIRTEYKWLDNATRTKSLNKVAAIREHMAYPEWLMRNAELDHFYNMNNDTRVKTGQYFEAVVKLCQLNSENRWNMLFKPVNFTLQWSLAPLYINAENSLMSNAITIPAAILQSPFFDPSRPAAMNYAGIGSIIGHEITHSFDDQGRMFDQNGNLVDWWTKNTVDRFNERAQCFVEQYGSITDPITGKKLNGANTLGENIADNGEIRQAYHAYTRYKKDNPEMAEIELPYFPGFDNDQIFFLAYANVGCGKARKESLKSQIDYDPHSPNRYRINLPLANFDRFAKAFHCPKGSPMNPAKRCYLW